jgi:ACS family glucarate transporter-like MFS transporter
MFGFSLAALALLAAAHSHGLPAFVAWFALTTFGVDFTLSPSWSASADLGGAQTGTLSAAMNMCGSIGAFASAVAFPWLLSATGNITAYFVVAATVDLAAVVMWSRLRIETRNSKLQACRASLVGK